jgi:transglutaminase-like putative cysteine protease
MILLVIIIFTAGILVLGLAFSLAAMISLPTGPRSGLESRSIEEAVEALRSGGQTGWELVRAATNLVDDRMIYCRRNNLQHFRRAFSRGLGFCQQQAFALSAILRQLGLDARPVQACCSSY